MLDLFSFTLAMLTTNRFALACPLVTVLTGRHIFLTCARTTQRTKRSRMPSVASKVVWHRKESPDLCLELACKTLL